MKYRYYIAFNSLWERLPGVTFSKKRFKHNSTSQYLSSPRDSVEQNPLAIFGQTGNVCYGGCMILTYLGVTEPGHFAVIKSTIKCC